MMWIQNVFMWIGIAIKSEVLYMHGYTWCDYMMVLYTCAIWVSIH